MYELKGQSLQLWLSQYFALALRIGGVSLNNKLQGNKEREIKLIKSLFVTYEKGFRDVILQQNAELVKTFELNIRVRKLQKFFRSKLSAWYKLMDFILKNKIEKYYDERGTAHFKTK